MERKIAINQCENTVQDQRNVPKIDTEFANAQIEKVIQLSKPQQLYNAAKGLPIDQQNKVFGFTEDNIDHVTVEFNKYYERKHGKSYEKKTKWKANDSYMPLLAVLYKIFDGDFQGVSIVEIGSGDDGVEILKFLQDKGAKIVGIDTDPNIQAHDGIVRYGNLMNLSSEVEHGSADVIYTHHLDSFPYRQEGEDSRTHRDIWKLREQEAAMQLDQCLRSGGVIVSHLIGADSELPIPNGYCNCVLGRPKHPIGQIVLALQSD